MLTFEMSMDPHSLDIQRDGKFIGYLQWHPERSPRVILSSRDTNLPELKISELAAILHRYEEVQANIRYRSGKGGL